MTENEYIQAFTILENETVNALDCLYMYKEINDSASAQPDVHSWLNLHPEFWRTVAHSLQTCFVVTTGRLFDTHKRSHSVHSLLKETVRHPEIFSREALRARKLSASGGFDKGWIDEYLDESWYPSSADLEGLRSAFVPVSDHYEETFGPIRDKLFAHRDKLDRSGMRELVGKALIVELEMILHFVHDLLNCLWHLLYNGSKIELGVERYDYEKRARSAVKQVLSDFVTAHKGCPTGT